MAEGKKLDEKANKLFEEANKMDRDWPWYKNFIGSKSDSVRQQARKLEGKANSLMDNKELVVRTLAVFGDRLVGSSSPRWDGSEKDGFKRYTWSQIQPKIHLDACEAARPITFSFGLTEFKGNSNEYTKRESEVTPFSTDYLSRGDQRTTHIWRVINDYSWMANETEQKKSDELKAIEGR